MISKVRDWLVVFRAHTGMLEAPIAAMGAALALGSVLHIEVVLWALFGLLYHFTGYGLNSYIDWKKGYDKDDPYKQHHPLNRGSLNPHTVRVVLYTMLLVTFAYAAVLAQASPLAILAIVVMISAGMVYNYWGKEIKYKFLPISLAHSMVFVVPYLTYASLDITLALVFIALMFHHTFQIMISGDIKDIEQDESSLLGDIGIEKRKDDCVGTHVDTSLRAKKIVGYICLGQIIPVILLIAYISTNYTDWLIAAIVSSLFLAAMVYESYRVISDGKYIREDRISHMSHREVVGYWAIYGAFIPVIGSVGYWTAFAISMVYLFSMSRFMWQTFMQPRV